MNERLMFATGDISATSAALLRLDVAGMQAIELLARHVSGDWGDVSDEDRQMNDVALANNSRLISVYHLLTGDTILIVTEADRSATVMMLPEEDS